MDSFLNKELSREEYCSFIFMSFWFNSLNDSVDINVCVFEDERDVRVVF